MLMIRNMIKKNFISKDEELTINEINVYRVSYRVLIGQEDYVYAESEADAIRIVSDKYDFPISNISVKQVRVPSIADYYALKEVSIFIIAVLIVLILILCFGIVK